jgi:pyridine nucleotide-disulfide oxidoreductase family protein
MPVHNSISTTSMKHLVLLGAGHAHVHVLQGLANMASERPGNLRITLVAPQPEQLYSGMVPGFVAGHYTLNQCVIPLDALMARCGAQYVAGSGTSIDPNAQTVTVSDGQTIAYDLLSLNTGSVMDRDKIETAMPGARAHALFVRPIDAFGKHWPLVAAKALLQPIHLAVVGAGAAGLELAMAAMHALQQPKCVPGSRVTLITGGAQPAQSYPANVQRRVIRALDRLRIAVVQDACVGMNEGEVILAGGQKLTCDIALLAIGAQAPAWLAQSGLARDDKGFIAVNHFQQSASHSQVFAVGDVASRVDAPHSRSGVYAVRSGPPLLNNLRSALAMRPLTAYAPPQRTLNLLSCGSRHAIAAWGPLSVEGAWVWRLKDRIDRQFVRRYGG